MSHHIIHALIPAAGQGDRFGGSIPKQYAKVAGRPVLAHAIVPFHEHPQISGVTVVLAEDDERFHTLGFSGNTGISTVTGGVTRAESVLRGLDHIRQLDPQADWVLVHDAARPCLSRTDLDRLLSEGLANPHGAILAIPMRDTLKSGDENNCIKATVDRAGLWAAQTPQLFPLESLMDAMQSMLDAGLQPTDEAAAMEHRGARPSLVMGSVANIKITWPGDLAVAEAWLSSREMAE